MTRQSNPSTIHRRIPRVINVRNISGKFFLIHEGGDKERITSSYFNYLRKEFPQRLLVH